jgi:tight adherence protein C
MLEPFTLAALGGLSVALAAIALFRPASRVTRARHRLEDLTSATDDTVRVVDSGLAVRLFAPLVERAQAMMASLVPARVAGSIDAVLTRAGEPMSRSAFMSIWMSAGLGLPAALALMLLASGTLLSVMGMLTVVGATVAGLYLPWFWIRIRADARSSTVDRSLPDAIDLLVTNLEAGLGLQAAMLAVSDRFGGPLSGELAQVVRDVSVGQSREDSMMALAERAGGEDLRAFARAMAQAERNGIPIAGVLRNQSKEIRLKRQQRAREQAAKIPVKMTFGLALFIFPTIFLLILGPVALSAYDQFTG